jgi:hypothetical protein
MLTNGNSKTNLTKAYGKKKERERGEKKAIEKKRIDPITFILVVVVPRIYDQSYFLRL